MTPSAFDRLTRRAALAAGVAIGTVAAFGSRVRAQEATPVASPAAAGSTLAHTDADFLFVQVSPSATWAPKLDAEGVYTLTLTHQDGQTIFFSDRPQRIVGAAPTQAFLDGLGFTPADPPNAAIVAGEEVLVVELTNPAYDAAAGTLTYDATPLTPEAASDGLTHLANQQADQELPADLGPTSLFIDSAQETCSNYTNCWAGCEDGFLHDENCYVAGFIPGGIVDSCYSWTDFSCEPCDGSTSKQYYYDQCNQAYPDDCKGNCRIYVGY